MSPIEAVRAFPVNCTDSSSVVKRTKDILKVKNSQFIYSQAQLSGGGVHLRLKNSLTTCVDSSVISFVNCTFQGNSQLGYGGIAIHSVNYLSFQYIKHLLPHFNLLILNSTFYENRVVNSNKGSSSGVISFTDNYYVRISDVDIYNNTNCSGLLAIGSHMIFAGEAKIHNNYASSGGGILLCSDAIMFLRPYT